MVDQRLELTVGLFAPPPGTKLWHGGATPVGALRGVDAEAAAWKPSSGRHSIWELTLHLAYWNYAVWRRISGTERGGFPRTPSDWPAAPDEPTAAAWKADRSLLRAYHGRLAEAMSGYEVERLDETIRGTGKTAAIDLFMGSVLHDTYHAGQIQMLKRMAAEMER